MKLKLIKFDPFNSEKFQSKTLKTTKFKSTTICLVLNRITHCCIFMHLKKAKQPNQTQKNKISCAVHLSLSCYRNFNLKHNKCVRNENELRLLFFHFVCIRIVRKFCSFCCLCYLLLLFGIIFNETT